MVDRTLAQRLDPKATWDELVLPDEEMNMLHQLADQVGQRGKVYEEWGGVRWQLRYACQHILKS